MHSLSQKIIIGSLKQIMSYRKNLDNGVDWRWCYFGVDIERKAKIETLLSKEKRYYYAKELYKLSHELKVPFLDWIAQINAQHKNNLRWWAARLASKSPLQSDFFLLFCYFNLIQKWISNKTFDKTKLLILIEDPYLHRLLETQILNKGILSVLIKRSRLGVFIANTFYWIKSKLALILFLLRRVTVIFSNSYLKLKFRRKFNLINSYSPEIMVFTYLDKRSFRDDIFKDVYKLDFIARLYEKCGYKTIISFQFGLTYALKNKILKAKGNYFVPDFYLSVFEWFRAIFLRPILTLARPTNIFQGIDYSVLFLREYLQESASTSFWLRLSTYYAYKNYFQKNQQIKLFIYPFENQPWEKMVLMAVDASGHTAKTAGYQHSSIPEMEINHFLGSGEDNFSPYPDFIIANGSHYEKVLNSAGFKGTKIVNGGSIRYAKKEGEQGFVNKINRPIKNILFLLQPPLSRSLEVIYSMKNIVSGNNNLKIWVKPHPGFFNKRLEKAIKQTADAAIVNSSLDEVLSKVDLVVYSSTTAALEALNRGIPVYKIDTELIDLDILEDLGLKIYKMNERQEIKVDSVNFEDRVLLPRDDIISEPIKEEAWMSLL